MIFALNCIIVNHILSEFRNDCTVRPFQSSKKVLWLCMKTTPFYTEFYADFEIVQKNAGRHKSYNIKLVRGYFSIKFLTQFLYGGSVVLRYCFSKKYQCFYMSNLLILWDSSTNLLLCVRTISYIILFYKLQTFWCTFAEIFSFNWLLTQLSKGHGFDSRQKCQFCNFCGDLSFLNKFKYQHKILNKMV